MIDPRILRAMKDGLFLTCEETKLVYDYIVELREATAYAMVAAFEADDTANEDAFLKLLPEVDED